MPTLRTNPSPGRLDLARLAASVQRLLLWLEPAGGQSVARRNAWACMVEDTHRRAQRADVERSLSVGTASERAARRTAIG